MVTGDSELLLVDRGLHFGGVAEEITGGLTVDPADESVYVGIHFTVSFNLNQSA